MAEGEKAMLVAVTEKEEEENGGGEKWLKHYSSAHQILLVGDGDFSFSLSLAVAFGSASNIIASSLDSYDAVIKKYKQAKSNLEKLKSLGAFILHGVDATQMRFHSALQNRKFDRIIFNFPHAGFHGKEDSYGLIEMHRNLVRGFFKNASGMLKADGEVHVNHKIAAPYCQWNLEQLASQNSLDVLEHAEFKIGDYPGYNNKRGQGSKCDEPFPLGECWTFKFIFSRTARKSPRVHRRPQEFQGIPIQTPQQHPYFFQCGQPQTNLTAYANNITGLIGSPPTVSISNGHYGYSHHAEQTFGGNLGAPTGALQGPSFLESRLHQTNFPALTYDIAMYISSPPMARISNECSRIFSEYFNHVEQTFGRADCDVRYSVRQALDFGFGRYMAEFPGRPLTDYTCLLQELHQFSISRSEWLRKLLLVHAYQL